MGDQTLHKYMYCTYTLIPFLILFLRFPRPQKEKCKEARPRNPYKWQKLKETLGIEDQTASVKHLHSVSQEDDKQMITKLFCEWITSLVIFLHVHIKVHGSDMKPKKFYLTRYLRVERPVIWQNQPYWICLRVTMKRNPPGPYLLTRLILIKLQQNSPAL